MPFTWHGTASFPKKQAMVPHAEGQTCLKNANDHVLNETKAGNASKIELLSSPVHVESEGRPW